MKHFTIPLLLAVLVVGAFTLGRLFPPEKEGGDGASPPSEPPRETILPGGQVNVVPPAAGRPDVVDANLVRGELQPGKTHKTILEGTIRSVGTDQFWLAFETKVNIHYVFEAQVDREIIANDGDTIVEKRHFRSVRSVKFDTTLEDFRLKLGPVKYAVLAFAAFWDPKTMVTSGGVAGAAINDISAKPILDMLNWFGVDVLKITGQRDKIFKAFARLNSLNGKSIQIAYRNKAGKEGQPPDTGIRSILSIAGEITPDEQFFHQHSAVLSDVLIFPERSREPGQTWHVKGNAFSHLIDPALRANVGGEVVMVRHADRKDEGPNVAVLHIEEGRLTLDSVIPGQAPLGWFDPRGELLFSRDAKAVVKASLSGRGKLEHVAGDHLLFKTKFLQEPQISAVYSCEVVDTVKGAK